MKPARVRDLYRRGRRIKGWLDGSAAALLVLLDETQKRAGISGDLFEIGCFHGKSALLLGGMVDPARERLGVCDTFGTLTSVENPEDEIALDKVTIALRDGRADSGYTDFRDTFLRNFEAVFPDAPWLHVHTKRSGDLEPEELGSCRFIHIDGYHSYEVAYEDLKLASGCLHPQGVVVLDDAFQAWHPGVTEAIVRFVHAHPDRLRPVILGHNKLALAAPDACDLYAAAIQDAQLYAPYYPGCSPQVRVSGFCGAPLHTFVAGGRRALLARWLKR